MKHSKDPVHTQAFLADLADGLGSCAVAAGHNLHRLHQLPFCQQLQPPLNLLHLQYLTTRHSMNLIFCCGWKCVMDRSDGILVGFKYREGAQSAILEYVLCI